MDIRVVFCKTCRFRFGKYSTLHEYPECVEKMRKLHNCRLIQQSRVWLEMLKPWFYIDPNCSGEIEGMIDDDTAFRALVNAEEKLIEAKAIFCIQLISYENAEALVCSWVFSAFLEDEKVRTARANVKAMEAEALACQKEAAKLHGYCSQDTPRHCRRGRNVPSVSVASHVDVNERVRRAINSWRTSVDDLTAAMKNAEIANHAVNCILVTVNNSRQALIRAMDQLALHADQSGLPIPMLGPRDCGNIVIMKYDELIASCINS